MDLREKTQNENRHPWELSRTKNLLRIVKRFLPDKRFFKIADVGAGDMYFARQLAEELKEENITPTIFAIDKEYSKEISHKNEMVLLTDLLHLEKNSMDCIIMMDVLEHIENDSEFLELVLDKLADDGVLIITVPAFQSLFSLHDTYLLHFRRYQYQMLQNLLLQNKFDVVLSHYFYTTLYFARLVQIKFDKIKSQENDQGIGMWRYSEENYVTKGIELILNVDFHLNEILNRLGLRLPGLSLLAVAKKHL